MNNITVKLTKTLGKLAILSSLLLSMNSYSAEYDYDYDQDADEVKAPKTIAQRLENFYVFANSGVSNVLRGPKARFAPGYTGGGGIGYYFNDLIRTDINVSYRETEVKKNGIVAGFKNASNISYMWSLYLNLTDREDRFVPYLTAGVGVGYNKLSQNSFKIGLLTYTPDGTSTKNFVWNAGVGGLLKITDNILLDTYYRYIDLGQLKGNVTLSGVGTPNSYRITPRELRAHELGLGLMIRM